MNTNFNPEMEEQVVLTPCRSKLGKKMKRSFPSLKHLEFVKAIYINLQVCRKMLFSKLGQNDS